MTNRNPLTVHGFHKKKKDEIEIVIKLPNFMDVMVHTYIIMKTNLRKNLLS